MKELVLSALWQSVARYPEVKNYLSGAAAWYVGAWAVKEGEAPDDEQRLKDERRLERDFDSFFQMQLERILKEIRKEYKGLRFDFWSEEERLLWESMSADFVGILVHGVNGGMNSLGDIAKLINIDDLTSPIINYGRQYRSEWLHLISETTRDFVEKSITEWIASGDPLKELIKTLSNPDLGTFSKQRAKRIAVTETTRLYAQGNRLAWEKAGVRQFIWQTARDERVCDPCGERHNQVYPIERMGEIPLHVNCRCWAKPIVNYEEFGNEIDRIMGR